MKKVSMSVLLPIELWLEIAKYCERHHVTRSAAIRQLIRKGLDSE